MFRDLNTPFVWVWFSYFFSFFFFSFLHAMNFYYRQTIIQVFMKIWKSTVARECSLSLVCLWFYQFLMIFNFYIVLYFVMSYTPHSSTLSFISLIRIILLFICGSSICCHRAIIIIVVINILTDYGKKEPNVNGDTKLNDFTAAKSTSKRIERQHPWQSNKNHLTENQKKKLSEHNNT